MIDTSRGHKRKRDRTSEKIRKRKDRKKGKKKKKSKESKRKRDRTISGSESSDDSEQDSENDKEPREKLDRQISSTGIDHNTELDKDLIQSEERQGGSGPDWSSDDEIVGPLPPSNLNKGKESM